MTQILALCHYALYHYAKAMTIATGHKFNCYNTFLPTLLIYPMPELPEIETTKRGISPHITAKTIAYATVRQPKLRWPIPEDLSEQLAAEPVLSVSRRAKYLLIQLPTGVLIIHLGMSGSLRIHHDADVPPQKHDHVDIVFTDGTLLRYKDPRRFGAILWFNGVAEHHPLLSKLGPEPLSDEFNSADFYAKLQQQKRAIKLALMDNHLLVGVGNIYANEALFRAGIHPLTPAKLVSKAKCQALVREVKAVLQRAIETGGSTLRDFVGSDGQAGYFQQEYCVYGRAKMACRTCGHEIEQIKIGQRTSFYCPVCQKQPKKTLL